MDDAEIARRVIGLLTLAYHAEWDPAAGADLEAVQAAMLSLTEDIGVLEISGDTPLVQYTIVEELLASGMIGLNPDMLKVFSNFISIFVMLSNEIKEEHPDFDIDEFLQRKGLEAADE